MVWGAALGLGAKALGWGTVLTAGAGGATAIAGIPKAIREGYLSQDIPEGGYDVPWWQKLLIDEKSLKTEKQKREIKRLENDQAIAPRLAALADQGVVSVKPGETKVQFLARTNDLYESYLDKKRRARNAQDRKDSWADPAVQWQVDREKKRDADARRQTEFQNATITAQNKEAARQFDNNLAMMRMQQADNLELQRDKLGLGRLELQMNQDRYMYEAETRRQEAREKRTSNLVQALAGLGAAFAI